MQIDVRMPVVEVDGTLVALLVGTPDAEFGDGVTLHAVPDNKFTPGLFVASVDSAPIRELATEVLSLFGFPDSIALVEALERRYGTGFTSRTTVTIYTLIDGPVEESV